MSWVAVAIGGSALLGFMGSQNAASAQTSAANAANATQQSQYNQTRQDQMPWMNRGNAAGNQLAYLMGLPGYGYGANGGSMAGLGGTGGPRTTGYADRPNGVSANDWAAYGPTQDPTTGAWSDGYTAPAGTDQAQYNTAMGGYGSLSTPFSQTNWQADPGYQFRLEQGQKALERSGAAKGMTLSGAQSKALLNYGQGAASQEYQNAYNRYNNDNTTLYNRLAGISGTGQTSANAIGTSGMNMANQIGANQMNLGNGLAASGMAGMNALSGGLNSWTNQSNWNNYLNQGGGNSYNGIGTGSGQFDWANGW